MLTVVVAFVVTVSDSAPTQLSLTGDANKVKLVSN